MRYQAARVGVFRRTLGVAGAALLVLALGAPLAHAAPEAPQVTATWIESKEISGSKVTLRTQVNPREASTTYFFEYTTEAAFLANGFTGAVKKPPAGESVGSGNAPISRSQIISTGLVSATSYRYRVNASNSQGSVQGPIRSFTTDAAGVVIPLPDSRGWEMVSPIDKNGGEIQGFGANFGGDVLQAAAAGGAVTYSSRSSFANAEGAPAASQYVSSRGGSGWSTNNVTLPTESGAFGDHPNGVPYQLFSPTLGTALMLDGRRCEAEPCPRSFSLRNNATAAVSALPYVTPDLNVAGASPDLAHLVLSTCAALLPSATEVPSNECDPAKPNLSANLYERSGSTLRQINFLPGDTTGTPGATLAAQSRAISSDGSRVYWTNGVDLYLRTASTTVQVDEDATGGGTFETASDNGLVAYFSKGGHLWRYLAASDSATDLTPGGEVMGVLGASDNGGSVYYLTPAGLFLWRSSTGTSIAIAPQPTVPVPQATPDNYPPTTGTARVSADGSHLAFVSTAELTSYDNRNHKTGKLEPEAYVYAAPTSGPGSGTIACASCNPSGESPIGAASLTAASPNGTGFRATRTYKPRALSANGNRLFFNSFDALSPDDTNEDRDVYQWEAQGSGSCGATGGCISLISSGRSEDGASFIDASEDGADAFFLTDGSLVNADPGSVDVYDARVGGGFPEPKGPIVCVGDNCQPLPPEPEDPTPGTLRPGRPNKALPTPKTVKCKKGQVKRHGKCVKKKKKKSQRSKGGGKK